MQLSILTASAGLMLPAMMLGFSIDVLDRAGIKSYQGKPLE
jgi:hypothetical protein